MPTAIFDDLAALRKRSQEASDRFRALKTHSRNASAIHRQMRSSIFKERAFHRLPSVVVSKYYHLQLAIQSEVKSTETPLHKLKASLFVEHLLAPKMSLEDLENLSRNQVT